MLFYLTLSNSFSFSNSSLESSCYELLDLCDETGKSLSHNLKDMNQIYENSKNDLELWKTVAYYHYTTSAADSIVFEEAVCGNMNVNLIRSRKTRLMMRFWMWLESRDRCWLLCRTESRNAIERWLKWILYIFQGALDK